MDTVQYVGRLNDVFSTMLSFAELFSTRHHQYIEYRQITTRLR